jgi:hypothetical protein
VSVTEAAATALGHDDLLVVAGQVDHYAAILPDLGALGEVYYDVIAVLAVHAIAAAGFAVTTADYTGSAVAGECVHIVVDTKDDVTTTATIAAVGSTHGAVFLMEKARAAIAALARLDFYIGCICKHVACIIPILDVYY